MIHKLSLIRLEDTLFLNTLQKGVARWVADCQRVTLSDRDADSGTAIQEASYWLNMERALGQLKKKRESEEVLVTLDALKQGKRFHVTVRFVKEDLMYTVCPLWD